ncbi:DUF4352 domain-containing protein [Frankia sp. AgB32]|uniref:DUF4352 domain-containing protein n=1 Tax=Frankia sp. AgB32 TaxID=631119 RepID=UPI0020104C3C|nr:DUF4352 domain-containing protein [Frankia sp. AgB32]MCK9894050.1 DUF4352 domain-containing protein [Frankia sp. AgB32]
MTDQNPPHQPPGGDGNREPWNQPGGSWPQPAGAPGAAPGSGPEPAGGWGGPDQSDDKTQLAWSGGANAPSGPQPPNPGLPPQWGTGPQQGTEQSWPPPAGNAGQPAWGQPGGEQQNWGQPGADQQNWAQQGWGQQGGGYQGTGPYQGGTGYQQQAPAGYPGGQDYYQQNQQGGYPPPGGGYPPQGGWQQPPGGPPQRRRNPLVIIVPLVVVAAIVIGVVIALAVGGNDDSGTVSAPTLAVPTLAVPTPGGSVPTQAAPAPTRTSPAGVSNCVAVTPQAPPAGSAGLGGSGTVVGEANSSVSDFEAKVTLNSVCTTSGAVTSYGDPPTQGAYYILNVTVEVSRGDTSASPSDFYIQTPDGTRYDGSYDNVEPRLSASTVKAGQKVRGNIVINAPAGHGTLNWEPLFAVSPAKFQL